MRSQKCFQYNLLLVDIIDLQYGLKSIFAMLLSIPFTYDQDSLVFFANVESDDRIEGLDLLVNWLQRDLGEVDIDLHYLLVLLVLLLCFKEDHEQWVILYPEVQIIYVAD